MQQECGDNGHQNQCGDACLSIYTRECALGAQPHVWGVSAGCRGTPYNYDQISHTITAHRDGGLTGCVFKEVPPFVLQCCPE